MSRSVTALGISQQVTAASPLTATVTLPGTVASVPTARRIVREALPSRR